ncbi:hypothetical protein ABIE67_006270 [Streptomyces sp. V4I8]
MTSPLNDAGANALGQAANGYLHGNLLKKAARGAGMLLVTGAKKAGPVVVKAISRK